MEFKKLSAVEAVESVSDAAHVLIEENGAIKRAPKDEVGGVKKELVYEWNFSADDEVYEVYENVNEDLSWMTKKQDDVGFEISVEFYGGDYRWTQEEGNHDYAFYENIYAIVNSTEVPDYSRSVNVPHQGYTWFTIKESLRGYISGYETFVEVYETGKNLYIFPECYFEVQNSVHYTDTGDTPMPSEVENGGFIVVYSDTDSPLKSVKIYKVTH